MENCRKWHACNTDDIDTDSEDRNLKNLYISQEKDSDFLTEEDHRIINSNVTSKQYSCLFCGKFFTWKCNLQRHMAMHAETPSRQRFTCATCNTSFSRKNYLRNHLKKHNPDQSIVNTSSTACKYCGKNLSSPWALKMHFKIHTGEMPFSCGYCDRKFRNKYTKDYHVNSIHFKKNKLQKSHTIVQSSPNHCNESSTVESKQQVENQSTYIAKPDVATGNNVPQGRPDSREQRSQISGLKLKQEGLFSYLQSDRNPYQSLSDFSEKKLLSDSYSDCTQSNVLPIKIECQSLSGSSNTHLPIKRERLSESLSTHEEQLQGAHFVNFCTVEDVIDRPYKCHICSKTFTHKFYLQRHLKIHSGIKPHKCPVCGKAFIRKQHLDLHNRMHTGEEPYVCGECGKHFRHRSNLLEHYRAKHFAGPENSQKEQCLYTCKMCEKKLCSKTALKNHEMIHNNTEPYLCNVCGKKYAWKSSFRYHLKNYHQVPCDL